MIKYGNDVRTISVGTEFHTKFHCLIGESLRVQKTVSCLSGVLSQSINLRKYFSISIHKYESVSSMLISLIFFSNLFGSFLFVL